MQVLVRSSAHGHVTDRVTVGRATGRPLPSLRCPGQGRLVDRWPFASSSLPGTVAVSVARATFPLCCVQTLGTATDVQTESCGTRSHRCHWHFLGKTGQREQQRGRSWPRARLGSCPPGAAGAPGGRRGEHSQGSRCAAWGPAIRLPPPSPGGHWSPWEDQSCSAVGAAPGTRPGWRRGRAVGGWSGRKPALSPAVAHTPRAHAARGLVCVRAVTLRLFLRRLRARVTDAAGVAESNARLPLAGGACRSGFGGAHPPSMGPSRDAEPLLHGPGPARGPPTAGPPGGAAHSRLLPSRGRGSNQGPREGVAVPSWPPRHARPDAALALALRGLPQTPRGLPCHTQFRDSPGTRRRLGAIAEQPLVVNTVS